MLIKRNGFSCVSSVICPPARRILYHVTNASGVKGPHRENTFCRLVNHDLLSRVGNWTLEKRYLLSLVSSICVSILKTWQAFLGKIVERIEPCSESQFPTCNKRTCLKFPEKTVLPKSTQNDTKTQVSQFVFVTQFLDRYRKCVFFLEPTSNSDRKLELT